MTRIAVLDDWQGIARASADWSALERRAELRFFEQPLGDLEAAARALADFDMILAMRERTAFPAALIERLSRLRLLNVTGSRTRTLDLDACTARGITVCSTGGERSGAATAELALGLLLAAVRCIRRRGCIDARRPVPERRAGGQRARGSEPSA